MTDRILPLAGAGGTIPAIADPAAFPLVASFIFTRSSGQIKPGLDGVTGQEMAG